MRLFRGERDITEEVPASALVWKRISRDPVLANGDAAWNASHAGAQVEITANEIAKLCRFECSYSETEGVFGSVNVDESLMATHNPSVSDASDVLSLNDGMLVVSGSPRSGNADYYLEEGKLMVNPGFTGTITAVADFSPEAQRKVVSFFYDHNGLRIRKVVWDHGVTETYDYTLHGKLITHMTKRTVDEEGNESGQELHFFYDAQSKPVFVEFEGERYRYVHSLQGDIIAIVDSAGNRVVEYKYDVWGKPILNDSVANSIIGDISPFRYRGYVWDKEINLYYLRSRFFEAELGRFISPDIIVDVCDFAWKENRNVFAYCYNSPCENKDAYGTGPILASLIVGTISNVVSGFLYAQITGDKDYGWDDVLVDAVVGACTSVVGIAGMIDDCYRVFSEVAQAGISAFSAGVQYWEDCKENSQEVDPFTMISYTMCAGVYSLAPIPFGEPDDVSAKLVGDVTVSFADSLGKGLSSHGRSSIQKKNKSNASTYEYITEWRYDPLLGRTRRLVYDSATNCTKWIYAD